MLMQVYVWLMGVGKGYWVQVDIVGKEKPVLWMHPAQVGTGG